MVGIGDIFYPTNNFYDLAGQLLPAGEHIIVILINGDRYTVSSLVSKFNYIIFEYEFPTHFVASQHPATLPIGTQMNLGVSDAKSIYSKLYGDPAVAAAKGPQCECGQKGVSYAKHSDYCPLYSKYT